MKAFLLRFILLAALVVVLAPVRARAQGNDNPTGVAGIFNGNSTTGCSYDPYTSNATRAIPDITVSGAVGAYPLQWSRTMNSRSYGNTFGFGGGWRHSYQWVMADSETFTGLTPGAPSSYGVAFPDGRFESFSYNSSTQTCTPFFPGIRDRFLPLNLTTLLAYLVLPDGGMVEFKATKWSYHDPDPPYGNTSGYTYKAQRLIDPNGLSIVFTRDATGKLTQVTEPAGRWLKIYYRTDTSNLGFVDHVDAGYGTGSGTLTQIATYNYGTFNYLTASYQVLIGVSYSDGTSAAYSYQHNNVSPYLGQPLISTCNDVRYPGPMKNITYEFVQNGFNGQLYREKHPSGAIVTTLASNGVTRTETRGDGAVRTFTYGAYANGSLKNYLLLKYTDFLAKTTSFTYDSSGYVNSVKDANQHTTSFTRLAATGAITKITFPYPLPAPSPLPIVQYVYEDPTTGYYLKSVTDELGHLTTYKHGNTTTMNTSEVDYFDGGVEKFTYNGLNQILTHTMVSNLGGTTTTGGIENFTYDLAGRGLLTKYTPPAGTNGVTQYSYDVNDHLSTVTDPLGHVATFYHDQVGRLTFVQHDDADNSVMVYTYNSDGTLKNQIVQLNATDLAQTDYVYDDYKRLRTVTSPIGNVTNYYYDTFGNAAADLTHTDSNVTRLVLPPPSSKVTKILYDANLRKQTVTVGYGSGNGAVTQYTYDDVGNLKTMKDPNGYTTGATWIYNYDERDRLINVTDPFAGAGDSDPDRNSLGHTIDYTYDAGGNVIKEVRANDQIVSYDSYDEMNRLLQMTVHQAPTADAVTKYTYSKAGKMLTMVDPKLHTYTYTYDLLNRLTKVKYPLYNGGNPTEDYLYDIAGNLYQFTNRRRDIQTFIYDSRNRQTQYSWSNGSPQARTLVYDDASRVTKCNTLSTFINFAYYLDDTLKSQEFWTTYFNDGDATNNHRTITYTYDENARRSSAALPGTTTLGYTYTARGELESVTSGVGGTSFVAYTYDKNSNVVSRALNNTTSSLFAYDAVNRLTNITHNLTGNPQSFDYAYDAAGRRKYERRNGNLADGFGYDSNGQLRTFMRDGTFSDSVFTPGPLGTTTFNFDASGNRTSVVNGSTTTTYGLNNLNEYTSINGIANLSYDDNGNLLDDGVGNYTYDAMNRVTQVVKNGVTEKFYYDGLNRQVARSATGQSNTISVWDGWNLYAEYEPTSTVPSERLVYGAGGDLTQSPLRKRYYYADGLGSTSHVAGSGGGLLERYTYDLYGTPTVYDSAGNVRTGGTIYDITRLYTGQQWHAATGLYDNRNRFLLPSLGRFLQPDPIGFAGDPANLYRYCANNPVNWSDPYGLDFSRGIDVPRKHHEFGTSAADLLGFFGGRGGGTSGNAGLNGQGEPNLAGGLRLGDMGIDHSLPSGVGPIVNRTFTTTLNSDVISADSLILALKGNLNWFASSPNWYSGLSFSPLNGGPTAILLGNSFAVDILGPWNGNVIVSNVTGSSFTFSTLAGHPESGSISFSAFDSSSGHVTFTIESTFQASSQFSQFASQYLGGHWLQSAVWWNFSSNVISYGGGLGTTTSTEQIWGGP